MRRLLHFPLSPFGRVARLVAAEKGVQALLLPASALRLEATAALSGALGDDSGFVAADPQLWGPTALQGDAQLGPALIDADVGVLFGTRAVLGFFEEACEGRRLLPAAPGARAEARRLIEWSETELWRDVVEPCLTERLVKRSLGLGAPDSARLRGAAAASQSHVAAFSRLLESRRWAAGEELSAADFAAAAQISVLDYLGEVPWSAPALAAAREWYALMKSRPAFRPLLADRAAGLAPAAHYTDLDF